MISGTRDISKVGLGAVLAIAFMAACGSGPGALREYLIDVKAQMLRGASPKEDRPLSFCETTLCYAYEDKDVRAIKKYIAELESRLKECQK